MGTRAPPLLAYAQLAASMALVGSYVGLSRALVAVFPVFLLAWLRFGIAALVMPHWLRRMPGERPLSRPDAALLFWQSFFGNFLFSLCMLWGVALTSALAAGVVMAAIPAAVALLSRVFLGERIKAKVAAGIVLAVAGVATLAWARHGTSTLVPFADSTHALLGQALLVGAVLCEASYVVIGKRLVGQVSPRRISAMINLWGLALATPLGLWQAFGFDFAGVSAATWALLSFYAVAASMIAVWLWMRGLTTVPAPQAGVFTVMLPIASAAVGVLVLGEQASGGHALALALAVAGVLVSTWPPGRRDGATARVLRSPEAYRPSRDRARSAR